MLSSPDVVVVGDINVDIVVAIDRYPEPGGHGLAQNMALTSGGSAANTAASLGRLGFQVAMIGRVGDDPLAERALEALYEASVDTSSVVRDRAATTGLFLVAVSADGERTMFGGRGANAGLVPSDIDDAVIASAQWLHLSGYPLLSPSGTAALFQSAAVARRAGIPVSFDPGIGPAAGDWRDAVLRLGAVADVLLPNEVEAWALTGEADAVAAMQKLCSHPGQVIALKRGDRGCVVAAGPDSWEVPAFPVRASDTTGAGDAFNAGFIAGRLAGFDHRASALLANALGGVTATVMGTAAGVWRLPDIVGLLESSRHRQPWAEWSPDVEAICGWLRNQS
jgi:sugar/nucleoside kinase (ribokinase family)